MLKYCRSLHCLLLLCLGLTGLAGCDQAPKGKAAGETTSFDNYVETGDLTDLRDRGVIRLLVPRFDEDPALPRDGLPTATYHDFASDFVDSLGLRAEWVYVDSFDQLIGALNHGDADILVTNLTRTAAREKQVSFSVPLAVVEEVLVLPAARADTPVDKLKLEVALPAGTAWQASVEKLVAKYPQISVRLVSGTLSDWEMLEGVARGDYQATVLDSDVAAELVPLVKGLAVGPVIRKDRKIAWATRQDNPELRQALNDYLVSTRIVASRQVSARRSWSQIRKSGTLRVITSNNPASYFIWRGELMGFDYDLINEFARQHKLRVSMVVRDGPDAMHQALEQGQGDVIAAAMTETTERRKKGWTFSRRYLQVTEQLVGPTSASVLTSLEQLNGKTVAVNPEHSYMGTLLRLQEKGIKLHIKPVPDATSEMLMAAVADGRYDLTLVDSHLAAMETTFRDDIHVVYDLGNSTQIGWVVRKDQPQLLSALNGFIRKAYRGLHYNIYYQKYFAEPKSINRYREQRIEPGRSISPYDELVYKHAKDKGFDWRMLTSQMYQESHFNPDAKSYAGAVGLMQMLPRTGRQFGYRDIRPPEKNIAASIDFLQWLEQRFPDRLPLEERIYFSLAAYNAGQGHVQDARSLARRQGLDPDRWFGNVEKAMLLLSQPRYARQARYGYVRGSEPVAYVRDIRERYVGYLSAGVDSPQ